MRMLDRTDSLLAIIDVQERFYGDSGPVAGDTGRAAGDTGRAAGDTGRAAGATRPVAGATRPVAGEMERLALVTARCAWLAGVAAALGVPVLVTEEDPDRNGPTDASILARLPEGTPRFSKPVFGLADVPEILIAVEATGRRTVVLAGLETDVCVAQSAFGLLEHSFRVIAVTDALFSPGAAHEHGLARMRAAGVELLHAKGVYYEWVRTLEVARSFEAANPGLREPPGFSL